MPCFATACPSDTSAAQPVGHVFIIPHQEYRQMPTSDIGREKKRATRRKQSMPTMEGAIALTDATLTHGRRRLLGLLKVMEQIPC